MNKIICILLALMCGNSYGMVVVSPWRPLFEGVEQASGWADTPRLQQVQALRIDLQNPHVSFYSTPGNGTALGDTNRQTGSEFVMSSGVKAAINAHFYSTTPEIDYNAELIGLSMCNGQIVSIAENLGQGGRSLLISRLNTAWFQVTGPTTNLSNVWTAIEAWPYILNAGVNIGTGVDIHPRSAVGNTQDNRYLILMTVDGRQKGYSEGATYWETAEWLKRFGAYRGLNLDGGGSTHLAISNGNGGARNLNSPSENRAVGSHLGVFSEELPFNPKMIYADFEGGPGTFWLSPGYSGSTTGIDKVNSTSSLSTISSYQGNVCQKLTIVDSSAASGGWLVRHLSGSSASRSQNLERPTRGYVGLWASTTTPGLEISIAIDNTSNVTADRGNFRTMQADGQWHLYEWNLEDNSDWHGWINGDGVIDTVDFTLDSIQLRSASDQDAVIYLDRIAHFSRGSLRYWDSLPGDFGPDGRIDMDDLDAFAGQWMKTEVQAGWDRIFDLQEDAGGIIDINDLMAFAEHWLESE
ncbi:MAG: phosphodiester glycosidase family protein [Planctomycetaceae bacterium]|nr:phosphodiester glycosidase family protein [Planctomycetaceae bacterium]